MLAFLILIFGLLQPTIYVATPLNQKERIEKEEQKKYTNSGLTPVQIAEIKNKINTYSETDKPYLNAEYSLEQMAKDLNITRQNLSQTINEGLEKSFFQLINELRIVQFKTHLSNPKMSHITLLDWHTKPDSIQNHHFTEYSKRYAEKPLLNTVKGK